MKKVMLSLLCGLMVIPFITGCDKKEAKDEKSYVGNYGVKVTQDEEEAIFELYLREDGTFKYVIHNFYVYAPTVGTYKVDGDKIILEEKVIYGSDACYFKEKYELKTIAATIKNDNTLSIDIDGSTFDFVKGVAPQENDYSKEVYVINPVDGKTDSYGETWMNCDNN